MTNRSHTGLVIVASTRAAAGEYNDESGALAVGWLRERGIETPDALIVADADMPAVMAQLFAGAGAGAGADTAAAGTTAAGPGASGSAAGSPIAGLPTNFQDAPLPDVILTSGGTGVSPTDVTVDAVERYITRPLPGIAAEFFRVGAEKTPTAVLSRCVAGVVDRPARGDGSAALGAGPAVQSGAAAQSASAERGADEQGNRAAQGGGAELGNTERAFVMTLPGSRGGVKDGLAVLDGVLEHLLAQLAGEGDHERARNAAGSAEAASAAGSGASHTAHAAGSAPQQVESVTDKPGAEHEVYSITPPSGCCHSSDGSFIADPPHVAEQVGVVVNTTITDQPLESLLSSAKFATITPAMGAVSTFEGTVRDHDGGQLVESLTYTCHPTATHVLREVAEEVVAAHPEVRAWVAHRTGPLEVGEMAFLVVIAAAHRGPAFAATAEMADQVKARVPIWKEQTLRDGTSTWVGLDD